MTTDPGQVIEKLGHPSRLAGTVKWEKLRKSRAISGKAKHAPAHSSAGAFTPANEGGRPQTPVHEGSQQLCPQQPKPRCRPGGEH